MIPVREISASIDQAHFIEDDYKRNFENEFVTQETMNHSPTVSNLYRPFSMPHIYPINTIAHSYFENIVKEPGISSYPRYSPHISYDYQIGVVCPSIQMLQYQPIDHVLKFRKDSSSDMALDTNCTFIYADRAEESKNKSTEDIKFSDKKPKSARKRKPKDRPKRPLSAYNLYFQQERQKILSEIPDTNISNESLKRKRRARPKIPHGKIGFESLAKEIGQRWQRLNAEQINHYKCLAMEEMIRYKEAMRIFRKENEISPANTAATPRNVLNVAENHVG
jgi:hypothetical protein